MKRISFFSAIAALLTLVAAAFAGGASYTFLYQPETPEMLKR